MNSVNKPLHTLEAVLLTIILTVVCVKGDGGCKDLHYLNCIKNTTFEGHVIRSFRMLAPGLEDCQHKCYVEDNCVSYNLGPVEGIARSCELNNADHWMLQRHVVPKEGFEYCPIKNPCSSNPCPSNKICTPDFAWGRFSCVDGIWTPWTSWTACHDLPDCPKTRTRNCTNPSAPQNIGSNCLGPALDKHFAKECQTPTVDITGCENALGMEDKTILDSQITASSTATTWKSYAPQGARLNNQPVQYKTVGAWVARNAVGEYIQVDLGGVKKVTKIATQGRPSDAQWVTKYSMSYSNDTSNWTSYYGNCVKKFPGNSDSDTVVTNKLEIPITARHIRVIVQGWKSHAALRMELYGCTPP